MILSTLKLLFWNGVKTMCLGPLFKCSQKLFRTQLIQNKYKRKKVHIQISIFSSLANINGKYTHPNVRRIEVR